MKLFIILYADDTVLMTESSSNLQTLLDKFYLYCDTWKIKVNVDKTKIVIHITIYIIQKHLIP
jgi:hypothetical protein